MHCIIISGSCSLLLPCSRLCPLSTVAQLVLCHPAEGERHDRAVPDNTSPRVSITARFEQEAEMLGARPPSMRRPGIMFQHVGLFMIMHVLVCKCFGVYWGIWRRGEWAKYAGMWGFYKTDSGFSVCVFSNPLMFAPLGYHRLKFQKGALH